MHRDNGLAWRSQQWHPKPQQHPHRGENCGRCTHLNRRLNVHLKNYIYISHPTSNSRGPRACCTSHKKLVWPCPARRSSCSQQVWCGVCGSTGKNEPTASISGKAPRGGEGEKGWGRTRKKYACLVGCCPSFCISCLVRSEEGAPIPEHSHTKLHNHKAFGWVWGGDA